MGCELAAGRRGGGFAACLLVSRNVTIGWWQNEGYCRRSCHTIRKGLRAGLPCSMLVIEVMNLILGLDEAAQRLLPALDGLVHGPLDGAPGGGWAQVGAGGCEAARTQQEPRAATRGPNASERGQPRPSSGLTGAAGRRQRGPAGGDRPPKCTTFAERNGHKRPGGPRPPPRAEGGRQRRPPLQARGRSAARGSLGGRLGGVSRDAGAALAGLNSAVPSDGLDGPAHAAARGGAVDGDGRAAGRHGGGGGAGLVAAARARPAAAVRRGRVGGRGDGCDPFERRRGGFSSFLPVCGL
jgi:hypothetical protein